MSLLLKGDYWLFNFKVMKKVMDTYYFFSADYMRERKMPIKKEDEDYTFAIAMLTNLEDHKIK